MKIFINGEEKGFGITISLEDLIIDLGLANKKIAIELNNEIIPRSQLKNKLVVDGDKIEIINAVGGG